MVDSETRNHKSAIRNPHSAIRNPKSEIPIPQSEIQNPQSEVHNPQSEIPNLPLVIWPKEMWSSGQILRFNKGFQKTNITTNN